MGMERGTWSKILKRWYWLDLVITSISFKSPPSPLSPHAGSQASANLLVQSCSHPSHCQTSNPTASWIPPAAAARSKGWDLLHIPSASFISKVVLYGVTIAPTECRGVFVFVVGVLFFNLWEYFLMSCRWGELLEVLAFRGQEPGMQKR